MPIFVYSARNIYGKKLKGELVCDSRQDALNNLKLQKLFAFRLNEKRMNYRQKSTGKVNAAASIKKKSISIFARQFASMLRAEIPLSEILDILTVQEKNPEFKKILRSINADILKGGVLSMAMSKYKAFPPLMINLVEAGEVNGRLELAFERIADGMEKELKLTSKVKGAMVYPVILLTVCLIASILLTFIVLPIFTNLFEQMGVELPLLTSIFIKASKFAIGNWHFIIVVVMLAVLSGAFLLKNRATRKEIDRMLLELPYIGGVYNTILMARFTRTFSTLLEGGVEVLTSLEISKKVVV